MSGNRVGAARGRPGRHCGGIAGASAEFLSCRRQTGLDMMSSVDPRAGFLPSFVTYYSAERSARALSYMASTSRQRRATAERGIDIAAILTERTTCLVRDAAQNT